MARLRVTACSAIDAPACHRRGRAQLPPADTFGAALAAPIPASSSTGCGAGPAAATARPARARACRHPSPCGSSPRRDVRRAKSSTPCAPKWQCAACTAINRWAGTSSTARKRRYDQRAHAHALLRCAAARTSASGMPGTQPKGLMPWFSANRSTDNPRSCWATRGSALARRAEITALDSGCVWAAADGRALISRRPCAWCA